MTEAAFAANLRGLVRNRVLLLLVATGIAAASGLAFLSYAPNRLLSGTGISLAQVVNAADGRFTAFALVATLVPALMVGAGVFVRPTRATQFCVALTAAWLLAGLTWVAAEHAAWLATSSPNAQSIARTSFGGAFWILAALAWLAASDAISRLGLKSGWRLAANAAVILPVVTMIATGALNQLSLLKEYINRKDVFDAALLQHVQLVMTSLAFALLVGVPLGIASVRNGKIMRKLRPPLFATLGIIQTIPSIALFGMLMVPLALLAANLPALGRAGISGVGLAPAVIALTLYALLPVVRSTLTALQQVSRSMADSARALGLTRWQVLRAIELPLALPVMLAGVRTAAVAAVGMAAVAALIGAGGLGSILFEGLFANAQDLVLLGVLPIIALGVATDLLFQALTAWARARAQLA